MKNWWYSCLMWLTYIGLFLFWKFVPSRGTFLGGGLLVIVLLITTMVAAKRQRYFTNRVDLWLHAYVIVDVCLETVSFEAFRVVQPAAVELFHNNNNFVGCALAFLGLIGGYRWYALRQQRAAKTDGAACGQVGV